jgi:hypothetical protein
MALALVYAKLVSQSLVGLTSRHKAGFMESFKCGLATLPGLAHRLISKGSEWNIGERMKPNISAAVIAQIRPRPFAIITAVDLFVLDKINTAG